MNEFKIRASAASQIMGAKGLGKTGETYIQTWLKEQIYSRRKEFSNKYTEKGIAVEEASINYVAEKLGYGMLLKNEKHFNNDCFTGTPDVILKDHIIDVKNSWDCFTFPLYSTEIDKAYYWQAQVYMDLLGVDSYKLIYVLSDTPADLIQKEAYYYAKNNGFEELTEEIYNHFVDKMTYPNIEDKYKIKVFDIERKAEDVEKLKERVRECRRVITNLIK